MAIRGVFNSSGKQHVLVHPFCYQQQWAYVLSIFITQLHTCFVLKTEVYIMFIQTIALQFFAARESLAIQVGFYRATLC